MQSYAVGTDPGSPPQARSLGEVRPFLKWAGGKRQLLPALRPYYPRQFKRYIEPFLGSGAVFFDLLTSGLLRGRRAWLLDVNSDLLGCYRVLRDDPEGVIEALGSLARKHQASGSAWYYHVRDNLFNPIRAASVGSYTPELAAMLIYLNRTGFNGLFRLNRSGAFNVPAGRYSDPTICDAALLRAVAAALRRRNVALQFGSFDTALAEAGPGDFVYCDPPYAPLSRTASFSQYTAGGFAAWDQLCLQRAVIAAASRGAALVVSNSSAPEIVNGYSCTAARRAGLVVHRVPARRAINARATKRGPVDELIVTNVAPQMAEADRRRRRSTVVADDARLSSVRPRMAKAGLRGPRRTARIG